ncbi:MAG TPA: type 1 glutamine amidotransferase domain-containing protein [Pseudonocardiaceae bacterium]
MRILVPVPDRDFDVTEVSVPWRLVSDAGHEIVFATEHGAQAPEADPRLLDGVIFGQLGADPEAKEFYRQLSNAPEFRNPIAWRDIVPPDYDGLILPGGHARGMRQYLGSPVLRDKVAEFWALERPIGAICHGVLVLARTVDSRTNRSVIADRRTTCLPKYLERGAYYLTAWRHGRYYRTYQEYVEDEVTQALNDPSQFVRGPRALRRGSSANHGPAFVVEDRNYVSARWPGDAYLFAERFLALLEERSHEQA